MKSVQELKKIIAIGAAALLLLPALFGCAVSAGGTDLPVPVEPTAAAPANTQAVKSVTGTGSIDAKRLYSIEPVERPIAPAPAKAQVINVLDMQGTVTVVSGGTEMPAYADMRLSAGDKLTTGKKSSATLDLNNGGMVLVEADSSLEITQSTTEYIEVSLLSGNIINNIEQGAGKYAVKANNVTMGVLGTVFRVKLNGGIAKIDLYEGRVSVTLAADGGETHTYDLAEGMSFEGTDETISNSIEKGSLETEELNLTELSDDALDWITQSLEEREGTDDAPEMLKELIDALHQEDRRRQQNNTPAAPPSDDYVYQPAPVPAPSPAPAAPNLVWANATMEGIANDETIVDYSLSLLWSVQNSTTPWHYGYHWDYEGWNHPTDRTSTYVVGDITYLVSSNGTDPDNSLTVRAQPLNGAFDGPDSVKLYVILVPADFDNVNVTQVYDHNTVEVNNTTPTITVGESATDPGEMSTVTVTQPTEEIENYSTLGAEPVVIPVASASYEIDEGTAEAIAEVTVYPEGEKVGMAVDSADGDAITVDVYLPTEVTALVEEETDP